MRSYPSARPSASRRAELERAGDTARDVEPDWAPLLRLQRLAGNSAVAKLLTGADAELSGTPGMVVQRAAADAAKQPAERTAEQVAALRADILTVIQQMEVGSGNVTESAYHTSSGIRASYASKMQATIPWTIGILKGHRELREQFDITMDEIKAAEKYMAAVVSLWKAVRALPAEITLEEAKADEKVAKYLPASGLDDDELQRMLTFSTWSKNVAAGLKDRDATVEELSRLSPEELAEKATKAELNAALAPANKRIRAQWAKDKNKGKAPAAAVADLTDDERSKLERKIATRLVSASLAKAGVDAGIGLDAGSTRRYVAQEVAHQDAGKETHWGEDLAAWQRYVVEKSLPDVAEKIKSASIDDKGMTLGYVSIADQVGVYTRKHPDWTDEQIAKPIFRAHNGGSGYATDAMALFKKLRASAAPATQ